MEGRAQLVKLNCGIRVQATKNTFMLFYLKREAWNLKLIEVPYFTGSFNRWGVRNGLKDEIATEP